MAAIGEKLVISTGELLQVHSDLSSLLSTARTLKEAMKIYLWATIEILDMDSGGIYLLNESDGGIELVVERGFSDYCLSSISKFDADSEFTKMVMKGEPYYGQFRNLNLPMNEGLRKEEFKACAIVPIVHEDKIYGSFNIISKTVETFPREKIPVMDMVITELVCVIKRFEAEDELRRQKTAAQQYLDIASVIFVAIDSEGVVTMINKKGCELLGYCEDVIVGKNWFDIFIPSDEREMTKSAFYKLLKGLIEPVEYFENAIIAANGEKRIIAWHNTLLRNDGKIIGTLSSGEDITDKKKAELQLMENQTALERAWRVNALSEMATGFAHELNQPLCAIENYAKACENMLEAGLKNKDDILKIIASISKQVNRAGDIIGRIRSLASNQQTRRSTINVNSLITECVEMTKQESEKHNISVFFNGDKENPHILGDRIQIQQVVLNLLKNAYEALGEKDINHKKVNITSRILDGGQVEVSVGDNAKGLDGGIADKIFESFFTTKSEGLGIGLSLCRRIIEKHKGDIWVDLNSKDETVFKFILPMKG